MGQSRVQQLGERITESGFVRNVIGPKVLEPVTVWYEENLRSGDGNRAGGSASPQTKTSDDGLIDPRDTRHTLGIALSAVHSGPVEGTDTFGVFRM